MKRPARRPHRLDLALQGGGAHGAFTWGVLDRLLDDERIEFAAVSGASAGAMNAVVLVDGLAAGGRKGARAALREFWGRVGRSASSNSAAAALFADGAWSGTPLGWTMDWMARFFGPTHFNPFDINPLRDIVAEVVDFDRVRAVDGPGLFVSVTNVHTGQLREFRRPEVTLDVVMASACLPMLFRAVTIDGEAYWDGGYMGNPSLLPLIAESAAHDLLLVQINPSRRDGVPTAPAAIVDRINEITFNASVVRELRTIALLKQLLDEDGAVPAGGHGRLFEQVAALRVHRIDGGDALAHLGAASKLQAAWPFVQRLHRLGFQAADDWLAGPATHLGRRSGLDLAAFR